MLKWMPVTNFCVGIKKTQNKEINKQSSLEFLGKSFQVYDAAIPL